MRGNVAERSEPAGIARPLAEIGHHRYHEIALADRVEQLSATRGLDLSAAGPLRQWTQRHVLVAEPGAGDLAVIGGGILSRGLVMPPRFRRLAERLQRAALPIPGARQRDRIAYALDHAGEMGLCRARIIEETQRHPACGELLLDAVIFLARGQGIARHPIGGFVVADVEELARDQSPLDPPLIGVERLWRFARDRKDERSRLFDLVGTPQPLGTAEDVADVALRISRHGVEQGLGVRRFLDNADAGCSNKERIAAEAMG